VLGIDIRALRVVWSISLFAAVVATAYAIRETLLVFVVALFFAYMLSPIVGFLHDRLPKRAARPLSLAIVYLSLIGILVAAGFSIGSRLVEEANSLAKRLPDLAQNFSGFTNFPLPAWLEPMRARIINAIQEPFRGGNQQWMSYVTSAGSKVISGLSLLFYLVLIPILSFFFLKDGTELRESLLTSLTNERQRGLLDSILTDIHVLMGQYIRALVILSLATFTTYGIFLSVTGASYIFLLSGIAAALEFIPVVGPLTAGAIVILVTAFTGYPHLVWFVIFWPCYRLFQDYVLSPYLMSSGVEVHPLLVLFGVLAGEQVAGVPGMFFSVPVIATLRVIYVQARKARRHRELGPVLLNQ
jgi:predicted PurR-regulated permease PerM